MDRFFEKLSASLAGGTFVKVTLSRRRGKGDLRNVYGRLVELKSGAALSFTLRYATRDVTRNEAPESAPRVLGKWLEEDFEEAHLFTTTGDWKLRATHDGVWSMKAARPVFSAALPASHDRPKVRALANAPFLAKLGVTAADGTARAGMADKLRQVERFVEILGHLVDGCALREAKSVRVCDMGAGKGYLTFATHEFFRVRGVAAEVTGVEQRADLVGLTNGIATEQKCEGLLFCEGSIGAFTLPENLDVLIALHACDTATDDALAAGVRAGAKLIVVAPCCQKEVRREFSPPEILRGVLRHGILAERQTEILTDGIRALALEAAGYDTSVFEFVSNEHTGKNVMIAATLREAKKDAAPVRDELRVLMDFFGLRSQRLVSLLENGDAV
ncbi:MAG: SAM-dependent methyltransferase [Chthoniobacteraceae bacterium]